MRMKLLLPIVGTLIILTGIATATYWHHKNAITTKHEKIPDTLTSITVDAPVQTKIVYGDHFDVTYRTKKLDVKVRDNQLILQQKHFSFTVEFMASSSKPYAEYIQITVPRNVTLTQLKLDVAGIKLPDDFKVDDFDLKNRSKDATITNLHAKKIHFNIFDCHIGITNTQRQYYNTVDGRIRESSLTIQNANITNYRCRTRESHIKTPNTCIKNGNVLEDHDE